MHVCMCVCMCLSIQIFTSKVLLWKVEEAVMTWARQTAKCLVGLEAEVTFSSWLDQFVEHHMYAVYTM